jgi:hypothetical protein
MRHTPPDLTETFKVLGEYMHAHGTNTFQPGRKTAYAIPDVLKKGVSLLLEGDMTAADDGEDGDGGELDEEDILGDL